MLRWFTPNRLFLAACAATAMVVAIGVAFGQEPGPPAVPMPVDPQVQAIAQAMAIAFQQASPGTDWTPIVNGLVTILSVGGGLYGFQRIGTSLAPQVGNGAELGARLDKVIETLTRIETNGARVDERSRETRREVRRLRRTVHDHASDISALAEAGRVALPRPPPFEDDSDDSDGDRR